MGHEVTNALDHRQGDRRGTGLSRGLGKGREDELKRWETSQKGKLDTATSA